MEDEHKVASLAIIVLGVAAVALMVTGLRCDRASREQRTVLIMKCLEKNPAHDCDRL